MTGMGQREFAADLYGIIRRDRQRRSRWRRFGTFLGKLAGALVSGFLTALLGGWMFMLAVGVIHDHWIPQCPPLGYWWAVLIAWLLRSALSSSGSASVKSEATS